MWLIMKVFLLQILVFQLFGGGIHCQASTRRHTFVVREASYTRLCSTKKMLTVNGQFPGPTIYAMKGETIIVDVYNRGKENVTIHWHGVNMPRYPWTDGPDDWTRATVHGAIIVYPKNGTKYLFHKPNAEVLIILGQWWKIDVNAIRDKGLASGADANASDSLLINGQPGDLLPCSKSSTFKLIVDHEKTYLLRIINAALHEPLFFSIAKHKMIVVGTDGSYTKPLTRDYITIFPGQTFDVLLEANQRPDHYYMAAKTYSDAPAGRIVMATLRSLADAEHPCNVPLSTSTKLIYTVSVNSYPCVNDSCSSSNGLRSAASINNISFHTPTIDILEAYYYNISGVYGDKFPSVPPVVFDFTAYYLPLLYQLPSAGTEVRVLEYNSTVEIVLQGTNLVAGVTHPMHLHGHSFYVVGWGFGNFDENRDPLHYNLVDPPHQNTIHYKEKVYGDIYNESP
ncbi:Laccase-14 [Vitis vinifera]|uniref:laccase n=1 Tax=Vitis vinifera TaxID=29760 RepID=A0A438IWT2_VITVI|nr:Laccase-14 [Vitis vinifera]